MAIIQPPEPLPRGAAGETEQEDGHDQGGDAHGGAADPPRPDPGEKDRNHRRPRFQSSSRA